MADPQALHAELLAKIEAERVEAYAPDEIANPAADTLAEALQEVLKLHKPVRLGGGHEYECAGCKIKGIAFVWADRCRTVKVISSALGVTTDG